MHKKRIFKFFRNTVSIALAVSLMLGEAGASIGTVYASESIEIQQEEEITEETVNAEYSGDELADNVADGVILHAWNWSFSQIKEELPKIAAAGFTTVQTSPVQPNKDGNDVPNTGAWWKFYQPTDFTIGNKLGSEAEFKELCDEAHKYGVKIIVDVVVNHLANTDGKGGNQQYDRCSQIPDYLRNNENFWHHNDYMSSSDSDRYQMTHGPVGMPDLNTSNEQLQGIIMDFLSNVQKAGADGFRFDTTKHIETPTDNGFASQFWPKVKSTTQANDPDVFLYGEILNTAGPGGYSDIQKYTPYLRVTNSEYGHNVRAAAIDKDANRAKFTNNDIFGSNGNEWVLWNESHDTYAGAYESDPSRNHSEEEMLMAWCAVAARTSPALYFSRPTAATGTAFESTSLGAHTNAYQDKRIAAVNKFHNAFAGETEYVTVSDNVLVVERGTSGVTLVNFSGSSKSVNIKMNKVKDGTYTEQVANQTVTVSGGTLNATIPDGGVAVIYNKGEVVKTPTITSSVVDGKTFSDTLDVTISVENATSAEYSLNGAAPESFSGSKKLTIGSGDAYGTTYTIRVTAANAEGTTEKTFTYTKKEAGKLEKNTVYFTKPSDWSTAKIYAYIPEGEGIKLTGEWSGTAMKDEGDGVYSYTFAESVSTCKVIFTDGSNQTPANV